MARFKKGQSGNPGGRPKMAEDVREVLRAHSMEAAMKLVDLMRNSPDERIQKACADSIIEQSIGKAPQLIELNPSDLTDDELRRAVSELVEEWKRGETHERTH